MSISIFTFKDSYKSYSGSLTTFQFEGIQTIIEQWEQYGQLTDLRQLAYILQLLNMKRQILSDLLKSTAKAREDLTMN
jgi:hypothetical protein